jgi:hypothetical protein
VISENGFPVPDHNPLGFMSYDGPPLLVKDRFVNFVVDPSKSKLWTKTVSSTPGDGSKPDYKHYEGDAAIGYSR